MRRGVTLGAETLRGCAAAGPGTALEAGAATALAAVAGAVTAAVAGAGAGVAADAAGCWADSAACVACSAAGAAATAGSLRSADESAARLGLERAASIPMATAKANTEREILQVIVWSMFPRRANPGALWDYAAAPFCRLSPPEHRRVAA
jgi:hypothetical protein